VLPLWLRYWLLPPKLHGHARSSGYVGSGGGGLLARHSATDGLEFQTEILSCFDSAAHGLTHERGDFDSALLHVEDDRAT